MSSAEIEQRIMSERRPQGPPPTPCNPALEVNAAYAAGEYTDAAGQTWRKGMDGWFFDDEAGGLWLVHHHDMAAKITEEAA